MESIWEVLPWGVLVASLGMLGGQAIEAGGIAYDHQVEDFCPAVGGDFQGSRLQIKIHDQRWIWVSCAGSGQI